jgi:hypothetical protein
MAKVDNSARFRTPLSHLSNMPPTDIYVTVSQLSVSDVALFRKFSHLGFEKDYA